MGIFVTIGHWITDNESLLSGAAAILVLFGVLFSALTVLTRRMTGSAKNKGASPSLTDEVVTLKDLSAPAPYPIHYAESDGLRIAFAKHGKGPHDIIMAPGIISHLNILSHLPPFRDTARALGEFSNLVSFDKRGQGLSDPCPDVPELSERVHDIEAVMDAAGLDKAILSGISEGGPMCIKFANDYPERVKGLILMGTTARWLQGPDFPGGIEEGMLDQIAPAWGSASLRNIFFPSITQQMMDDRTYKGFEHLIATRQSVKQLTEYMKRVDVRHLLPDIQCPTLVIHFAGDMAVPLRLGRALADAIPNAEFLELPGIDHGDLSGAPEGVAKIRQFAESLA